MIQVGYTTTAGADTVTGDYDSPVDANAAIYDLRETLADRDDIQTLFMQSDFGDGLFRYGYLDPIEA